MLRISNISSKDLPMIDKHIDPYVQFEFLGNKQKTAFHEKNPAPTWTEVIEFDLKGRPLGPDDCIQVSVKDHEKLGRDRLLGSSTINLRVLQQSGQAQMNLSLVDGKQAPTSGILSLIITYSGVPTAQGNSAAAQAGTTGVAVSAGPASSVETPLATAEETTVEEVAAEGIVSSQTGQESIPPFLNGGASRSEVARRSRRTMLPEKKTDFQVRVKIIEARHLQGSNINPVCRVRCLRESFLTRVRRGTNRPYFNESFFFNTNMLPSELFDSLLTVEVLNSELLRCDSVIGEFQLDLGTVFFEPGHYINKKWLLLTAPMESRRGQHPTGSPGHPVGYLLITIIILGPGDEAPPSSVLDADNDNCDVESNLFKVAGAALQPATFTTRVFCAEDLPQMDSGFMQGIKQIFSSSTDQKLVDPYVIVSFAGKSVKTKVLYNNDNPEFNQELHINFQFPSMCESLKIQIMDTDRMNKDDVISTVHLPLSSISFNSGDGFLPTFGPCYINFYGSTREFQELNTDHEYLNMGQGEGCAYRGRLLLSLQTSLIPSGDKAVMDLTPAETALIQPCMRRREYKLKVAFFGTFCMKEMKTFQTPLEFEVSIGNFGNKLDKTSPASCSNTQPTNSVFDGNYFYYFPWMESKPFCTVDSTWEDISFRLRPLNRLLKTIAKLEKNLEEIKLCQLAKSSAQVISQKLINTLAVLVDECQKPLPEVTPSISGVNALDLKLQEVRQAEMANIVAEARDLPQRAEINEAVEAVEGYLARLKDLSIESQNSIPDIVVWMLSGTTRVAYCRIPANEVMFLESDEYNGTHFGKLMNLVLKYPGKKAAEEHQLPCILQVVVWFGFSKHQDQMLESTTEGMLTTFAEMYENQIQVLTKWSSSLCPRGKFSDADGRYKLTKEGFVPPPGWSWDGDWTIAPETSIAFSPDTGRTNFMEDLFECQSRIPAGNWGVHSSPFLDSYGNPSVSPDQFPCPEGWEWTAPWQIDLKRAVDEAGWEYCVEFSLGTFTAVEKAYHLCRRRRWVRTRLRRTLAKGSSTKVKLPDPEGWEYAVMFTSKFHAIEKKMDMVRRRRWNRKMIKTSQGGQAVFTITPEGSKEAITIPPRTYLVFKTQRKYELRAYIYQARDVLAKDSDGFSDPYVIVSFMNNSQTTRVVKKTLCPTWDQTIIFEDLTIHGTPSLIEQDPPFVNVDFFDKDEIGDDDFLGRCQVQPQVRLPSSKKQTCQLLWYPIIHNGKACGELLAAFELFLLEGVDVPLPPPIEKGRYKVPNGVRPVVHNTMIEILCWGLRNMKKFQIAEVTRPCVMFEVGGYTVETAPLKDISKCPNFEKSVFYLECVLPKEEMYSPPLNIIVFDNRTFGRKPIVGNHVINSLSAFSVPTPPPGKSEQTDTPGSCPPSPVRSVNTEIAVMMPGDEQEFPADLDWWGKFYHSLGDNIKAGSYGKKSYPKFQVLNQELEQEPAFNLFKDFVTTFPLQRGRASSEEESAVVGELKACIKFYPLPSDPKEPVPGRYLRNSPASKTVECIVRVYILRAIDLPPMDKNGLADPYLVIRCGKKKIDDCEHYQGNTLNPVFGRMFELKVTVPQMKDLIVQIYDKDLLNRDDLIGETRIDLEDRLLTKYRATCGIPQSYCLTGVNTWRDSQNPKQILAEYCSRNLLPAPEYLSNRKVMFNYNVYSLEEFEPEPPSDRYVATAEDQRLALHLLNTLPLVKEHVELRSLTNPAMPCIEQGKLNMWVDIFPTELGPPGPVVNISPRCPQQYQLRVIIWNTADVVMDETSITGEQMSDIYVKGFMSGVAKKEKTDVHFRSLDGTGNFNWRMLFDFSYLPAEHVVIYKHRDSLFSIDSVEERVPPVFTIQIWDNDKFSKDDFLGSLEINLTQFPEPAKDEAKLKADPYITEDPLKKNKFNLFEKKRANGWWPVFREEEDGTMTLSGKVEMTVEVLTAEEVALRPAGSARDEPNSNPKLNPPSRPETSFLWFSSPLKTFKYIIWRKFRKFFIIGIIVILLLLFVGLMIYAIPGYTMQRLINGRV